MIIFVDGVVIDVDVTLYDPFPSPIEVDTESEDVE